MLEKKLEGTVESVEKLTLAKLYIKALRQFDRVVLSCFDQTLQPNYDVNIEEFMDTYRALQISIPLKVHLLESHAVEFLKMMGEEHGLGFYSEQAMESMHHDLLEEWGEEKVDEKHPNYGEKLK